MSKKDYIQNIEGAERRFITETVKIDVREEQDANDADIIEGYALKFNKQTVIGDYFREEIMPGALDNILNDDVRALFNHDPNMVLARSVNGEGTLQLMVDETGLKYRYETPNVSYAKDLTENIRLGNVSQSSFGFSIDEQEWIERDGELPLRQITSLKRLYDVSPVTYPAYQDTSVGKRSLDAFRAENIEVNEEENVNDQEKNLSVYEAQVIINLNSNK